MPKGVTFGRETGVTIGRDLTYGERSQLGKELRLACRPQLVITVCREIRLPIVADTRTLTFMVDVI